MEKGGFSERERVKEKIGGESWSIRWAKERSSEQRDKKREEMRSRGKTGKERGKNRVHRSDVTSGRSQSSVMAPSY